MRLLIVVLLATAALMLGRANDSVASNGTLPSVVEPTLFLNPARLAVLRSDIQAPAKQAMWTRVKAAADRYVEVGPPVYHEDSDTAQLWQRGVGDAMPFIAMAYLLTGDASYRIAAQAWALASSSYPHWGLGSVDGLDLPVGHQLLGLAIIYDWVDLDASVRETIRQTLLTRGGKLYAKANAGKIGWAPELLQNHMWVNVAGLAAAAFALERNPADRATVQPWIDFARAKFEATEEALGPDGASQEGVAYWGYGVEWLLKYWALAQDFLGESPHAEWWKNTASYRRYLSTPQQAWASTNPNSRSSIVDFADSIRFDWDGADYLLRRLATMNNDGVAQDLANGIVAANAQDSGKATPHAMNLVSDWLELVWYDPSLAPVVPTALPTMKHFADLGIVSSRTDWSGAESLVVFKCGPPLGHSATLKGLDANSLNIGHAHPDANHFVVFGAGEWLVRDDGYAWKETDQHNTLLIDGAGQAGEGQIWLLNNDDNNNDYNGKNPNGTNKIIPWTATVEDLIRITSTSSSPSLDIAVGDATAAYPSGSGLQRFVRRLLFFKPNTLVVVDDIEVDHARALELRLHPQSRFAAQRVNGAWLAQGSSASLRVQELTPSGVTQTAGDLPAKTRDGAATTLYTLQIKKTTSKTWRHAMALSWSAAGTAPPRVTLSSAGSKWTFHVNGRNASLNWRTGTVKEHVICSERGRHRWNASRCG